MKNAMNKAALLGAMLLAGGTLGACGYTKYKPGPDTVIARPYDTGNDADPLPTGRAAIAYDPDGCQGWIIDDGVEGYSGRRFNPKTGLPVCDSKYPPGTVIGEYRSDPTRPDYVPKPRRSK